MTVESNQDISFLEFVKRVFFVNLLSFLEPSQSLLRLTAVMANHTHIGIEHRRTLVDGNSTL
jgi:hypothetical protein